MALNIITLFEYASRRERERERGGECLDRGSLDYRQPPYRPHLTGLALACIVSCIHSRITHSSSTLKKQKYVKKEVINTRRINTVKF